MRERTSAASGKEIRWYEVVDRSWDPEDTDRYREGAYTGVRLRQGRATRQNVSLDFAPGLDNLNGLEVYQNVQDDSPAFACKELRTLNLETGSSGPIQVSGLPELVSLYLHQRPGLEFVRFCRNLKVLMISSWRGGDLGFLASPTELGLEELRLDGICGRSTSLSGVESCTGLKRLTLFDIDATTLKPLHGLRELTHLHVTGCDRQSLPEDPLDLHPLSTAERLEWLFLVNCGPVKSVAPLSQLRLLEAISFGNTKIVDGDLSPLLSLPQTTEVSFVEWQHYSHREAEIVGREIPNE